MKKQGTKKTKISFSGQLLKWNREENTRQMPWKGEKDPYKIWLSEIILQQTRVEQGLDYYKRFVKNFPDIHQLANAPDEKVMKLWEGLGYYSRCRNLITTARYISRERNGEFPSTYESIKELKGIGPYTAAAISSFAFNLPHAVVDGNVFRLLARVFGIKKPIDSTDGKQYFTELANELLDKAQPGSYNQAIMDFGAVVCKPVAPLCETCVFKNNCVAFGNNLVDQLPIKEKKINIRKRWLFYFVMERDNKLAIRQRTGKDIWKLLHEFPMIELDKEQEVKDILSYAIEKGFLKDGHYELVNVSPTFKQQLTHQLIKAKFLHIRLLKEPGKNSEQQWLTKRQMKQYAFPKLINQYLETCQDSR